LHGLEPLTPSDVVDGRHPECWLMSPSKTRARDRSKTYAGVGRAIVEQWNPNPTRPSMCAED